MWVSLCSVHLPVFSGEMVAFLVVDLVPRLLGISVAPFASRGGALFLALGDIVAERRGGRNWRKENNKACRFVCSFVDTSPTYI